MRACGRVAALAVTVLVACTGAAQTSYWYIQPIRPAFTTGEKAYLSVTYYGVPTDFKAEVFYASPQDKPFADTTGAPDRVLRPKLTPNGKRLYTDDAILIPTDKPGHYTVRAHMFGTQRTARFTVSDLGLVVKFSPTSLRAWVVNRRTNRPQAGAIVTARVPNADEAFASGRSDGDGLWQAPRPQVSVTVSARYGDHYVDSRPSYERSYKDELYEGLVYLYTDRPVYRPGDTVYFKGIAREWVGGGYEEAAGRQARIEVRDDYDTVVHSAELGTDTLGAFSGEFKLDSNAAPSDYRLTAELGDGLTGEAWFTIAEYRKPEFNVTLSMEPSVVLAGEPLRARLEARYYFGAPLSNTKVRWRGFVRRSWSGWWPFLPREEEELPLWRSERGEEYDTSGYGWGETPVQGEGVTGPDGVLLITLPTTFAGKTMLEPATIEISAEVLDIAGREGSVSASATILPARVFVNPSMDWVGKVGSPSRIVFTAADALARRAVPGVGFRMEIVRVKWLREKDKWREERATVERTTLQTGPDGAVEYAFTPKESGSYEVITTVTGPDGRTAHSEEWHYVYGGTLPGYWGGTEGLKIVASATRAQPGETITVLFQTADPDTVLWYTVEGSDIHQSDIVQVRGSVVALELPITREMIPSVSVWASYCRNGRLQEEAVRIHVVDLSRILKVEVTPGKERYEPGETATYRVVTTDLQGRPTPAEVSLGVVDEPIYAIRRDRSEDIRTFFYGPRKSAVTTWRSDSLHFEAAPATLARVFQKEEAMRAQDQAAAAQVRKEFRDTAFWDPAVRTGPDGVAEVSFQLPDNLTQWRATARAVGANTAVGEGVDKRLRVTKPLIASLNLPRFVTEGDQFRVIAVARNTTDQPEPAEITLEIEGGLELLSQPEKTVMVPANGERRYDIQARAVKPGRVSLLMRVRGGGREDAVLLPLTIRDYGSWVTHSASGTVTRATRNRVPLSEQRNRGTESVEFHLSPSIVAMMLGSVDELAKYPYGCIEQTTSPMLADLALLDLERARPVPNPELVAKLSDMIGVGICRLYSQQMYDGGWGWGGYSESDIYWTAYVIDALLRARSAGFEVNPDVLKRGVERLADLVVRLDPRRPSDKKKLWGYKRDLHTKVFALYALSQAQPKAWRTAFARMASRMDDLGNSDLALLAMALKNVGAEDEARKAYRGLMARGYSVSGMTFWTSDTDVEDEYQWYFGEQDTFTTAMALRAMLRFGADPAVIDGTISWLSGWRRGGGWISTNDTAKIAEALAEYVRSVGDREFVGSVELLMNGVSIRRAEIAPGSRADLVWKVTSEELADRDNIWEIRLDGSGSVRYTAVTRYRVPFAVQNNGAGVAVERTYLALEKKPVTHKSGSYTWTSWDYKTKPLSGPVSPGDEVVVKLTVTTQAPLRHAVIVDPLPAGLEPIDEENSEFLYTGWLFEAEEDSEYYWYGYSQREFHDDRVVLLVEDIRAGRRSFYYVVRAVTPGDFRAAPAQATEMYMPSITGSGRANALRVGTR